MEEGLNYAYIGNLPGHGGENTYCPGCKKPVISRVGYYIESNKIRDGKCSSCGHAIPGVWS